MTFVSEYPSKKKVEVSKTLAPAAHTASTYHHFNNFAKNSYGYTVHFQRTLGNQSEQILVPSNTGGFDFAKIGILQPKVKISQPGDAYEQEAHRVADSVMRMPMHESPDPIDGNIGEDQVNRKCSACGMKGDGNERMNAASTYKFSAPSQPRGPSPTAIENNGKDNSDILATGEFIPFEPQEPSLYEQYDDSEFLDGEQESDIAPEHFVNGHRTGRARAHWAGGSGAKGNQSVGHISLVSTKIESRDPTVPGANVEAWIVPRTGTAKVTRSYTGALIGANGPNYYVTSRAAARMDRHEELHISESKRIHDLIISLLESRVRQHTGRSNPYIMGTKLSTLNARAAVEMALRSFIDWNSAISQFRLQDTTANTPGGTVDTTDSASVDFYHDYGPRSVGGHNYLHYIDVPPGP